MELMLLLLEVMGLAYKLEGVKNFTHEGTTFYSPVQHHAARTKAITKRANRILQQRKSLAQMHVVRMQCPEAMYSIQLCNKV